MKIRAFSQLAFKHAQNAFQEELYIKAGLDITHPVKIYGIVNERCNYKCRYCDYWRLDQYKDEISIEQWKTGLKSLKDFIGNFHIEFSGGEPFMKKGFVDLMQWCSDEQINFGVTTNGSALNPKIIERFVRTRPFNVNISIDSYQDETHDYTRGIPGSLAHLRQAMVKLHEEQARQGVRFPLIVKPTVTAVNFRDLPRMARWAPEVLGATLVNFQPIDRWTRETYDELWIEPAQLPALREVVAELIELKNAGAPIMNSVTSLKLWESHFKEEKAPPSAMPCRVGLRNFFIRSNGDVEVCWYWPPIGNIKDQTAQAIWQGQEARKRREETTQCDRLCLFSCLSTNTLQDKVRTGISLLLGPRRSNSASESSGA